METGYNIALILHIICAIMFLGYIFTDLFILSVLPKEFGADKAMQIKGKIGAQATKFMPWALLTLILTGGFMISKYINSNVGYFDTPMQQLLVLKAIFGLLIGSLVAFSLIYKKIKGKPNPFLKKYIHKIAITLGFCIVLIAKLMFVV